MTQIFTKLYSSESLIDLVDDINHCISEEYEFPTDEYGFATGTFEVTIRWIPDVDPNA